MDMAPPTESHGLGIYTTGTSDLITAAFPFLLLLFFSLAELQCESPATAEGFIAEHCLHF